MSILRRTLVPALATACALAAAASFTPACSGTEGTPTTASSGSGGSGTGGGGTGGTGGGGAAAPQSFTPAGCAFSVATRPEYKDFSPAKPDVGATPNIRRVRLGLGGAVAVGAAGHADPATSIAFAWQTDDGTLASEVTWGSDPDPANWPAGNRTSGVTWLTPAGVINPNGDARMHEAYLCGLTPATTYYYRVGGGPAGSEVWSDVNAFATTPAAGPATVKIGITGDSRGQANDAWRLSQKRMSLAGVGLQLFSGDMIKLSPDQKEWEKWLDDASKDEGGNPLTLPRILTLSTHGNHENHTSLFFGNLTLPQDPMFPKYAELFYSVNVGPVHLVVLDDFWIGDPNGDPDYATALTAWLDADLAAANQNRAQVPWIVTVSHHSVFSSSNHGDDSDVLKDREYLVPMFDKHHVDLAVNGHDHNYERTHPLTGPLTGTKKDPVVKATPAEGTVYVVCAGTGAPDYSPGTSAFTAFSAGFNGSTGAIGVYGILTADATTLKLEGHHLTADAGGTVDTDPLIDSFTITK